MSVVDGVRRCMEARSMKSMSSECNNMTYREGEKILIKVGL